MPIFPTEVYRRNGRHVIRVTEPIEPEAYRDKDDAVSALTQAFTSRLEEFIRRHPEQWIWLHRRWKTAPEEAKHVDRKAALQTVE